MHIHSQSKHLLNRLGPCMQNDFSLNFPFALGAQPRNDIWCPDVLGITGGTADRLERCAACSVLLHLCICYGTAEIAEAAC